MCTNINYINNLCVYALSSATLDLYAVLAPFGGCTLILLHCSYDVLKRGAFYCKKAIQICSYGMINDV